ncbi:MAG: rod-binding protein [Alphaproteobacteria bacterium]
MADAVPPLRGAPLPQPLSPPAPSADIVRAAHQFESMFLDEMLKPMFDGLSTDGLGGGGIGEEMFRPMLIDQYAQALGKAGGIGLAQHLITELSRMQAMQAAPATTPAPKTEDEDGSAR